MSKNVIKVNVRVLSSIDEFSNFATEWESFRKENNTSNICLSHLWLLTWCRCFLGIKDQIAIHCFYQNNNLIGLFPIYKKRIIGGFQVRFIGTGEKKEEEICSEFQDFLLIRQYKKLLFKEFNYCISNLSRVISIEFDNVLESSFAREWFFNYTKQWLTRDVEVGYRYSVPVLASKEMQVKALASKNSYRQARKYCMYQGCKLHFLHQGNDVVSGLEELASLHNLSWRQRGIIGAFENSKFCQFHWNLAQSMKDKGQLVLFKISCGEKTIAIFYGAQDGNTLHYYQSALQAHVDLPSSGMAMHVEALSFAQKHNLEFYDLMKGQKNSYKQRIVKSQEIVSNLRAFKKWYVWVPFYWLLKNKIKFD